MALLGYAIFPKIAHGDACDFYKKYVPKLYERYCKGGLRSLRSNAGSGSASVADSFNINPSTLPTQPSPYGLETIVSFLPSDPVQWKPTFAIIKGFHKIGTGISTANNNTFYGNDILQRAYGTSVYQTFEPIETPRSSIPNINAGTSVAVLRQSSRVPFSFSLGGTLRFNQVTASLGWGGGFMVDSKYLNFGGGITRENISNFLPTINFYSVVVGTHLSIFQFDYTLLFNRGGIELAPIHIWTVTVVLGPVLLTTALRQAEYLQERNRALQWHHALQFQISKHISAGFLINYIPGTSSVALQLYL